MRINIGKHLPLVRDGDSGTSIYDSDASDSIALGVRRDWSLTAPHIFRSYHIISYLILLYCAVQYCTDCDGTKLSDSRRDGHQKWGEGTREDRTGQERSCRPVVRGKNMDVQGGGCHLTSFPALSSDCQLRPHHLPLRFPVMNDVAQRSEVK